MLRDENNNKKNEAVNTLNVDVRAKIKKITKLPPK